MDKAGLISEGRASIINGLVAYGTAFEIIEESEIDEDMVEMLSQILQGFEAMIPMFKALYDLDVKINGVDKSFIDWMADQVDKMK